MMFRRWPVALVLILGTPATFAADLTMDGFMSVAGGRVTEGGTEYAGYDDEVGFQADSVYGLQFEATVSDKLRATGQVIGRGSDDFSADVEWAYLSFDVSDQTTLRAGRLRLPFYTYSDFLDVSYAYPWIRPPEEVYGQLEFSSFEGVDVVHRWGTGNWSNQIQAYYGSFHIRTTLEGQPSDLRVDNMMGVVFSSDYNNFSVRVGYHQSDVTLLIDDLEPLFDALRAAGFGSVADAADVSDDRGRFIGLGVGYDPGSWFARGEWTTLSVDDSYVPDIDSWYATAGVRRGPFTYHLTYGSAKADPDFSLGDPIPGGVDPGLDVLKAAVGALPTDQDTRTVTVGMRWDFTSNAAFKVEYTDVSRDVPGDGDTGLLAFSFDLVF